MSCFPCVDNNKAALVFPGFFDNIFTGRLSRIYVSALIEEGKVGFIGYKLRYRAVRQGLSISVGRRCISSKIIIESAVLCSFLRAEPL